MSTVDYNFIEHTTDTIQYQINGHCKHDFELFFDVLCRNKNTTELCVKLEIHNCEIDEFVRLFRLPSNITSLSLPRFGIIKCKLKLPSSVARLTLNQIFDIENIDFTENTKLKYIETMEYGYYFRRNVDLSNIYSLETVTINIKYFCDQTMQKNDYK